MEKFIILNDTADKYYVSADILHAEIVTNDLNLHYRDKTVIVGQTDVMQLKLMLMQSMRLLLTCGLRATLNQR